MSARVFKPISLVDISKIKSSHSVGGGVLYKELEKVKRSLFNPDPEETKRFLHDEFAKLAKNDRDRWNFDFATGKPDSGRYEWIKVKDTPQTKRKCPPTHIENCSGLFYAPIESSSESTPFEEQKRSVIDNDSGNEIVAGKKQRLITDFLHVKKRFEDASNKKKMDPRSGPRPKKMTRLSFTNITS